MKVVFLLIALFVICPFAFGKRKIKWQCLNAINDFRRKAAKGGLNRIVHTAAKRILDEDYKFKNHTELENVERERSRKLMDMKVGPMGNVKRMYWDMNMERSATEMGLTCPQGGGRKGEKYREFSLYYDPDEYKDVESMLRTELEFMTPWLKDLTPPSEVNNTHYFYVAGEFFWATRDRIGCALVSCHGRTLLECHMGPGNTLEGEPYIPGKACSQCEPGYACDEKLCVPQGTVRAKSELSGSRAISPIPGNLLGPFLLFLLISLL